MTFVAEYTFEPPSSLGTYPCTFPGTFIWTCHWGQEFVLSFYPKSGTQLPRSPCNRHAKVWIPLQGPSKSKAWGDVCAWAPPEAAWRTSNHSRDTMQGELSKALARIGQEVVIWGKVRFISSWTKDAPLQRSQLLCHRCLHRQDCGLMRKLEVRVSQMAAINSISQQISERGISIPVVLGQDNVFLYPHLLFL